MSRRLALGMGVVAAAGALLPLTAHAAARKPVLIIKGAGFGHGVGMSQYGARGFALRRRGYEAILRHYYADTELGKVSPDRPVRVLMQAGVPVASFSGATRVGERRVDPRVAYQVVARGSELQLRNGAGKPLVRFASPLTAKGPRGLVLHGRALNGQSSHRYRGVLEFRVARKRVDVINDLDLDDYVAGVIGSEIPVRWPMQSLKAQAVAARSYAVTTGGRGPFDQYPDTRSQVYGGMAAEHPRTWAAVRATAGQVVTHDDEPVPTYFFSTSGGLTEDSENSFLGGDPRPWLRSVRDPYDAGSPRHRWTITMSPAEAGGRLHGLVKGRFRGIRVLKRGRSPRVVTAEIVGTRGLTLVPGTTLRARLELPDTWAYFAVVG